MKKFLTVTSLLIIGLLIFFGQAVIIKYNKDSAIAKNPAYTEGTIIDTTTSTSSRKGRTTTSYDFTYQFEANGEKYTGEFGTSESNAAPYLSSNKVRIVYNLDNPRHNGLKHNVNTDVSLFDLIWKLGLAVLGAIFLGFVGGLLISLKLGWLKESEKQPEPAAQETIA